MRYAVLVTGPAGAGKSTFCGALMTHLQTARRTGHLVNLDPAADASSFEYEPAIDIKDLIGLDDVMTELGYGPNGGLVYCFEYLQQNMDWLEEELGGYDDDYLIIDCPGQIELYTHHPFLPMLVRHLNRLGIRTCAAYLIESQFMEDKYKFFRRVSAILHCPARALTTPSPCIVSSLGGVLSAMSAMVNLEIPWINVMSKMDLVMSSENDAASGRNGIRTRKDIASDPPIVCALLSLAGERGRHENVSRIASFGDQFLDPDPMLLVSAPGSREEKTERNSRFHALNQAIVQLIEDHPLVSFMPLDLTNPDSIETVLSHIDYTMQYGEDEEPKEPHDLDEGDFVDME
ncbi:hypothetical protein EVJ58_g10930 [Rhodofomes roseus]|uniref:GPN-loop GTPase 3 n=1 Tax=Rhodofomes roseus TaxID=34475 RepID=A0A4Y9XMX0_9APHY|nr:hypothetical protein EVJ58_g10930 [Rhodofomes roseus]